MAEDDHRVAPWHLVLVSTEAAPGFWTHPQDAEEIPAHQRSVFHLGQRRLVRGEAELEILGSGQAREGIALLTKIVEFWDESVRK
jgi:hypothetical protein